MIDETSRLTTEETNREVKDIVESLTDPDRQEEAAAERKQRKLRQFRVNRIGL